MTCNLLYSAHREGFTLIELVVTIVIIGIMAFVTLDYLVSASQLYVHLLAQRQADGELMDAVDRLRWEARTAKSTVAAAADEWTFANAAGARTNKLTGSELTLNGNPLARGVDRLEFTYFNSTNGVTTNLSAIDHVELSFRVTNSQAASEMLVSFYLREGFLK